MGGVAVKTARAARGYDTTTGPNRPRVPEKPRTCSRTGTPSSAQRRGSRIRSSRRRAFLPQVESVLPQGVTTRASTTARAVRADHRPHCASRERRQSAAALSAREREPLSVIPEVFADGVADTIRRVRGGLRRVSRSLGLRRPAVGRRLVDRRDSRGCHQTFSNERIGDLVRDLGRPAAGIGAPARVEHRPDRPAVARQALVRSGSSAAAIGPRPASQSRTSSPVVLARSMSRATASRWSSVWVSAFRTAHAESKPAAAT